MNTISESSEAVLRKALDAAERRQTVTRIIAVVFALATIFFMVGAFSIVQIGKRAPSPESFQVLFMSVVVGLVFWVGAIGVAITAVSYRNTRAILKAIVLLSESKKGDGEC